MEKFRDFSEFSRLNHNQKLNFTKLKPNLVKLSLKLVFGIHHEKISTPWERSPKYKLKIEYNLFINILVINSTFIEISSKFIRLRVFRTYRESSKTSSGAQNPMYFS